MPVESLPDRERRVRPTPRMLMVLVAVPAVFLVATCRESERTSTDSASVLGEEQASFVDASLEPVGFALTTLPTSGVIVTGKTGAVCFSHDGSEEWVYSAPDGEEIVASPAVAPDSSTFILTNRSLVALSTRGDVLWSVAVEPGQPPCVIALGDGTASVTAGGNAIVNYEMGQPRWRFELPDGDTITSMPRVAGNSRTFVQGVKRLYVVDASGIPVWDKPL